MSDRYELLDVVGSGGMATVWRARDTTLGRVIALKRPHPAPADSDVLARFRRESQVAATVAHPNLVAVFDAGEDDEGPYLVMELVDGPSLDTVDLDPARIAAVGAQVASALSALHAAGIVHSDVKPANILLSPTGAKLTDFGIARPLDVTTTITQPGTAFATPAYAAPETLARGERTAAADVYSLGTVLHELVTGTRWSSGATDTRPAPADPAWSAILGSALSPDPGARPTAAELADRLSSLGADHAPEAASTVPFVPLPPPSAVPAARPTDPEPLRAPDPSGGTGRRAVAIFIAVLAVVGAVVLAVAAIGDDVAAPTIVGSVSPSPATSVAEAPSASSTTVTTSPASTETSLSASAATDPVVVAPVTSEASASASAASVEAARDQLVTFIDGLPREALNPGQSRQIVRRVDEAILAADGGDLDASAAELREAIDRVVDHVASSPAREDAIGLIVDLGEQLGVDPADLGPAATDG